MASTGDKVKDSTFTPGSNAWWTVRRVANGDARRPWYELSREDIDALQAEKDKLSAEVEQLNKSVAGCEVTITRERTWRLAAEAKFTALVEASEKARDRFREYARSHHDQGKFDKEARNNEMAEMLQTALAHHSAPEAAPREWDRLNPELTFKAAAPAAPTSAPVEPGWLSNSIKEGQEAVERNPRFYAEMASNIRDGAPVEDVGGLHDELLRAARRYIECSNPASGLSPYVEENGRYRSKSPWAELKEAVAALSPALIQLEPAVVAKPKWRSPETDAELVKYRPADPPPGPPTGPLLADTTNGQLWRFDMAGRLRKAIGRATAAELAALIQPQGEERS